MAISKERLEELIEKKATIYSVCYGQVFEEKLTSNNFVGIADDEMSLMQRYNGYEKDLVDYIRCLYETKEEANWVAEFGDIERTERLKLPTWEELIEKIYINEYTCIYYDNKICFDIYNNWISITLDNNDSVDEVFYQPLHKNTYIDACRKVKELFLGE